MFISFSEFEPWIKHKPNLGAWQAEWRTTLSRTNNTGNVGSTWSFYKELVEVKRDDALEEILGFDEGQLVSQFRGTFGQDLWTSFRDHLPGNVIEEYFLFSINSQGSVPLSHPPAKVKQWNTCAVFEDFWAVGLRRTTALTSWKNTAVVWVSYKGSFNFFLS